MPGESKQAIYTAIGGDLAIATIKFLAAAVTGSSAMLSEGIHSLVDAGNGGLLLFGISRSRKPPDAMHPFGHGKELYFWTLIVALLVFAVGGGVSTYEGIIHVLHPRLLRHPLWNYVVLSVAIVCEGLSFTVAFRAFLPSKGKRPTWEAMHQSKDPTTFMVVLEDAAALVGLVAALLGVYLSHHFQTPYWDGAASIVIGCLLAVVAIFLAYESKGLLVGENADPLIVEKIRLLVEADPGENAYSAYSPCTWVHIPYYSHWMCTSACT